MRILLGIILFLLSIHFSAFTQTTKGTRFWVSFMGGGNIKGIYTLILSADEACNVKIENPNTGWIREVELENNSVDTIHIPYLVSSAEHYNKVLRKSLLITSTAPVSLYSRYHAHASSDVACILPENILSSEYVVQAYPNRAKEAQFLVLATENNTIVDIIPSCLVSGNYSNTNPIAIPLNKGEVYQVCTMDGDISGTYIKAQENKKIAVFNGSSLGFVPDSYESGDHIFEQALPLYAWGNQFVVVNTVNRPANRIRITASKDDTHVMKNNIHVTTLNAYETYEFEIIEAEKTCYIETSEPCIAYQYMVGWSYMSNREDPTSVIGDPSMCLVLPLKLKCHKSTFITYPEGTTRYHRLAVIVNTPDVPTVELDGNDISRFFLPVKDNPDYSYTRLNILPGKHTLQSSGGFFGQVYGYGIYESYFYYLGYTIPIFTE